MNPVTHAARGLLAALLSASAVCASAQSGAGPSTEAMIDALAPAAPATRSLRNLQVKARQIDLNIAFDFNSAQLSSDSTALLERLSQALQAPQLQAQRFRIEGHTDGKGQAAYNQQLSERRAATVLQYLAQRGVGTERLQAQGKGFSELLKPDDPLAAENRRVRIVAIEP
jgi:outer membrane protein OmpA-like peptidoglycan-associated protein